MKVIVFGSTGMLGSYVFSLLKEFYEVVCINRQTINALTTTSKELYNELSRYKYTDTVIINCVGAIPQRNNLNESKTYIKINTLFPHLLAENCERLGYNLIHITTDCVYSGEKGNYNENDLHDETNVYGVSKSLGEPPNCTIIRTSIIGEELQNKKSLLEWVKSQNNSTINGFSNHYWNGVTCLQLSKIIHHIIANNLFWKGVKHIHSPDSVSKARLVSDIIDVYQLSIKVKETCTEKSVDKTLSSIFSPFIQIPTIRDQILQQKSFKLGL